MESNKSGTRSDISNHGLAYFLLFLVKSICVSIWAPILLQLSAQVVWVELTLVFPGSGGEHGLGPGWFACSVSLASLIGPRIGSGILLSVLVGKFLFGFVLEPGRIQGWSSPNWRVAMKPPWSRAELRNGNRPDPGNVVSWDEVCLLLDILVTQGKKLPFSLPNTHTYCYFFWVNWIWIFLHLQLNDSRRLLGIPCQNVASWDPHPQPLVPRF